jgi:putative endonuclease
MVARPTGAPSAGDGAGSGSRSSRTSTGASTHTSTGTDDERATNKNRALGAQGEARAARFLASRGYRIAERNVRVGGVEIDLIATRGAVVAFVEVKTRRTSRFGRPELAVDSRKQARMVRAAAAWLQQHRGNVRRVRFDVVACRPPQGSCSEWRIEHLPGAFDAGD